MTSFARALWRFGPIGLYVVAIFGLSATSAVPKPGPFGLDKLLHVVQYGVLGLLIARASGGRAVWPLAVYAGMGALLGAVDEWIQSGTPGRDASVWDVIADTAGIALGARIAGLVWRRPAFARFLPRANR